MSHAERLERGYRRLLACYPVQYRAEYGEEMIGVLMTASTPRQRRPDLREAAGLVTAGLRARLRLTSRATFSPAWRDAAAAFGYLAAVTLAAMAAYHLVATLTIRNLYGDMIHGTSFGVQEWATLVWVAGWTVAAVAAGAGARWLGAAWALVGTAAIAVKFGPEYIQSPWNVVTYWWILVLAVTAAAALVTGARGEVRPLGVRSRVVVGLAALLATAAPALEAAMIVVTPVDGGWSETYRWFFASMRIGPRPVTLINAVLVVALAAVVLRLAPSVRRRVVVLALPAAATGLVVLWAFRDLLAPSPPFGYLIAPQWIVLVAVPVLTFALGARLVARYERKLASGALLA